ncbi:MAG: dihydrofolate reductase family protein [Geminicoccaceae bacterium]|nr:dihydrofolate reductase family protein [Geminicoccaceae bacterium]
MPFQPHFEIVVVTSADGYLGRYPGQNPREWASAEEQEQFLTSVDAADWSFMGRITHETAPRTDRRRVIFSTSAPRPEWRAPQQLWVDPGRTSIAEICAIIEKRHPARACLILGATRVHDWFLEYGLVRRITLTIEPIVFGAGLPIVSQVAGDPSNVMRQLGFDRLNIRSLNNFGTRLETWEPR